MEIRDLKPEDIDEVISFKSESMKISFPSYDIKFNAEKYKEKLLKNSEKYPGCVKVVIDNEKIVGYIFLAIKKTAIGRYGIVEHLFVRQGHRQRGLAKALLSEAEKFFKHNDIKRIRLTVTLGNKPAIELYEKIGFSQLRTIMEKKLE